MEIGIRIVIIIALVGAVFLWNLHAPVYKEERSIREIARQDLSNLGDTGFKFTTSLSNWLYSILVTAYRQNQKMDVMPIIRDWAKEGIDSSVRYDVESPYTRFLAVIADAKDSQIDPALKSSAEYSEDDEPVPRFKVSPEYDYHVLPKILKFNDHVDCQSLIIKIDEAVGGAVYEQ